MGSQRLDRRDTDLIPPAQGKGQAVPFPTGRAVGLENHVGRGIIRAGVFHVGRGIIRPGLAVKVSRLWPIRWGASASTAATQTSFPRPRVKVRPCPSQPAGLSVLRTT